MKRTYVIDFTKTVKVTFDDAILPRNGWLPPGNPERAAEELTRLMLDKPLPKTVDDLDGTLAEAGFVVSDYSTDIYVADAWNGDGEDE